MVRIDTSKSTRIHIPMVPHYDIKMFMSDDGIEAVDWLPASSGEIVFAVCQTQTSELSALHFCQQLTRQFAYDRYDRPSSDCLEILSSVASQFSSPSESTPIGLCMAVVSTREHVAHVISRGVSHFRRTSATASKSAIGELSHNSSEPIETMNPGDRLGMFPTTPIPDNTLLFNSQSSFLNVHIPGPQVTGIVIQRKKQRDLQSQLQQLTDRERETLDLIMVGKTVKEIASEMNITIQTVSKHRGNLWDKLGVSNDVQVVLRMLTSPR